MLARDVTKRYAVMNLIFLFWGIGFYAHVTFTVLVLLTCAVLLVAQPMRVIAKRLFAGICGSWVGVILFLVPNALVFFLVPIVFMQVGRFFSSGEDGSLMFLLGIIMVIVITCASAVYGFLAGWSVAWELSSGMAANDFVDRGKLRWLIARLIQRLPLVVR